MFSLAGIPPLGGFDAKLFIITSLIQSGGSLLLPLLVVLFSLIGAFYYLRVVKLMYFDKPESTAPLQFTLAQHIVLSLNVLALLVLGMFPQYLLNMANNAVLKSLGF